MTLSEVSSMFDNVLKNLLSVNKLPSPDLGDLKPRSITAFCPRPLVSMNQIQNWLRLTILLDSNAAGYDSNDGTKKDAIRT